MAIIKKKEEGVETVGPFTSQGRTIGEVWGQGQTTDQFIGSNPTWGKLGGIGGGIADSELLPERGIQIRVNPDAKLGIGGAPTRNTTLPTDAAERKKYPMATGLLDYFPDALADVSNVSWHGNEQHNPGQPLHWARGKSQDEADTALRHLSQRGTRDVDGRRHTAKAAWRILALLQKEIEEDNADHTTARPGSVINYDPLRKDGR